MIRGIGSVYAKKLLRAFSEKVFDVIEAEPDRRSSLLLLDARRNLMVQRALQCSPSFAR
jgi:hypothetical protein